MTCRITSALVSKSQISIRHICLILKLALYKCHIIIIIIILVRLHLYIESGPWCFLCLMAGDTTTLALPSPTGSIPALSSWPRQISNKLYHMLMIILSCSEFLDMLFSSFSGYCDFWLIFWDINSWPTSFLTHWGWVMHICVSKLTITGSDNGLSPDQRQAIIWTNAGILLIELSGQTSAKS